MTITAIFLSGLLGFFVSGLATYLGQRFSKKVTIAHWIVNLLLGSLGSVSATQLFSGSYGATFGPMFAGVSPIPSIAGALVLAGIGTWCIHFYRLKHQKG